MPESVPLNPGTVRLPALIFWSAITLAAAVIGMSTAAPPLTTARIAKLPAQQQAAWREYLQRSDRQMAADRAVLTAELRMAGLTEPIVPPAGSNARSLPLNRDAAWYGSAEAKRLAANVMSFQTPAGGWSKNLNLADHARKPGEHFAPNNLSHFLSANDLDAPRDPEWEYVGTIDNDATVTEIRFLAKVATASPAAEITTAVRRGVDYMLAAQYPNGGWPQVWPLQGGYHDAITLNDGAMPQTLELLGDIAAGIPPFAFIDGERRKRAQSAVDRGLACILACQISVKGIRTGWAQQHDMLTLEPVAARNYEPVALSSSETAGVLIFLMSLHSPTKEQIAAIGAAVAWLKQTAIAGKAYTQTPNGRLLVDAPGAGPIWARFYQIGTNLPIFGDRDRTIHDTVAEISLERRNGYAWYTPGAKAALDRYTAWKQAR